jgi:hypothetical protein
MVTWEDSLSKGEILSLSKGEILSFRAPLQNCPQVLAAILPQVLARHGINPLQTGQNTTQKGTEDRFHEHEPLVSCRRIG